MVPQDHLLRKIQSYMDLTLSYELVEDLYSLVNGRPNIVPAVLLKLVILQYIYGIRSMWQTIDEVKVNLANRWFLGLGSHDPVPYFTTFSQNYRSRFQNTDLLEQIFQLILLQAME